MAYEFQDSMLLNSVYSETMLVMRAHPLITCSDLVPDLLEIQFF